VFTPNFGDDTLGIYLYLHLGCYILDEIGKYHYLDKLL
jgi:hypothetical protein